MGWFRKPPPPRLLIDVPDYVWWRGMLVSPAALDQIRLLSEEERAALADDDWPDAEES